MDSGTIMLIVGGGLAFFVLAYFIMLYNSFIQIRKNIDKSWSNIDVILKQRHDELSKLIAACKKYMDFEKSVLTEVTEARTKVDQARQTGDMKSLGVAEGMLRKGMGGLFAVAENYPDLKSNASFMQLQERISSLENMIADRRELYNEHVTINNVRVEQFPDVFVAKAFSFGERDLLEFSEAEKQDVNVGELFNA